jgi:cyclophilin family peptidyl-prolyl cis-trans isomerase
MNPTMSPTNKSILLFTAALILFAGVFYFVWTQKPKETQTPDNQLSQQLEMKKKPTPKTVIKKNKKYVATLVTDKGNIVIELNGNQTPVTVNNFVSLAKKKFYNNTIFHRVMKGFMIQGGDPKGDGTGGPGYRFDDEPFKGEYTRGTIAMANAGPDTNGSQFFIMHADYPLPKNYVIFGRVISGIEVVDAIAESPVKANAFGEESTPITPTKVKSVEITEQ